MNHREIETHSGGKRSAQGVADGVNPKHPGRQQRDSEQDGEEWKAPAHEPVKISL
jgi:hypothetical protein